MGWECPGSGAGCPVCCAAGVWGGEVDGGGDHMQPVYAASDLEQQPYRGQPIPFQPGFALPQPPQGVYVPGQAGFTGQQQQQT